MIWTYILKVSINNKTIYDKTVCIQNDKLNDSDIKTQKYETTNK